MGKTHRDSGNEREEQKKILVLLNLRLGGADLDEEHGKKEWKHNSYAVGNSSPVLKVSTVKHTQKKSEKKENIRTE